jgi:hypothetical protein
LAFLSRRAHLPASIQPYEHAGLYQFLQRPAFADDRRLRLLSIGAEAVVAAMPSETTQWIIAISSLGWQIESAGWGS